MDDAKFIEHILSEDELNQTFHELEIFLRTKTFSWIKFQRHISLTKSELEQNDVETTKVDKSGLSCKY